MQQNMRRIGLKSPSDPDVRLTQKCPSLSSRIRFHKVFSCFASARASPVRCYASVPTLESHRPSQPIRRCTRNGMLGLRNYYEHRNGKANGSRQEQENCVARGAKFALRRTGVSVSRLRSNSGSPSLNSGTPNRHPNPIKTDGCASTVG